MGNFTLQYCPICGSNRSENSFKKTFRKLPFGRIIESLGRGTLKTLKFIVNPGQLNLKPVKIRLLKVFRSWFDAGVITCRDLDDYLLDAISEYNEWRKNAIHKSESYRTYVRKESYPVFFADVSVSEGEKRSVSSDNQSVTRRINKSWK